MKSQTRTPLFWPINLPPVTPVSGRGHPVLVILSPGKDAEIGSTAFPNTQKIADNKQMDGLHSGSAGKMLSLLRYPVST